MPKSLQNLTKEDAYRVMYTGELQDSLSIANYWRDPFHLDEYLEWSRFLAPINNQTFEENMPKWRESLLQISKLVLIGGPDDGVIGPYYAAFFDEVTDFNGQAVRTPMTETENYINDSFGLKTLDLSNRITMYNISGVGHLDWKRNPQVFQTAILPYLY